MPVPSPTPAGTSAWLVPRTLLNLFLAGLMLRLLLLGYWSLSTNEGVVWFSALHPDGSDALVAEVGRSPLWTLLTGLWAHAFGESTAMLRTPAALLGIASLWLAWLLALRLFVPGRTPRRGGFVGAASAREGRRRAVGFAGLVAMSVMFIESSQEAAPLAALIAASLGLSLLYLRWLDLDDRLSLVLYAIVGALALYTHTACLWIVVGHAAHAVWLHGRPRPDESVLRVRPFLLAAGAVLLAFVPWLVHLATSPAIQAPTTDQLHGLWRLVAGPGLEASNTNGAIVLVTAGVWMILLGAGVVALWRRPGRGSFALFSLLVPAVCLVNAHRLLPALAEPRLVLLAPWLALVALLGALDAPRILRGPLLACLVLVTAAGTVAYTVASRDLVPGDETWTLNGRTVPRRYVPDPDAPLALLGRGHAYDRAPWLAVHEFVEGIADATDIVLLAPDRAYGAWEHVSLQGGASSHSSSRSGEKPFLTLRLSQIQEDMVSIPDLVSEARHVFLVALEENTRPTDAPPEALLNVLVRGWGAHGSGLSIVGPFRFGAARVVRVTVFTRS